MPAEIKLIAFGFDEIGEALSSLLREQQDLHRVVRVAGVKRQPQITVDAILTLDGSAQRREFDHGTLAAALMRHAMKLQIPLAATSAKELRVLPDGLVLVFKLGLNDERATAICRVIAGTNEPSAVVAADTVPQREAMLIKRESAIIEREAAIGARENAVSQRETAASRREQVLTDRESTVPERKTAETKPEVPRALPASEDLVAPRRTVDLGYRSVTWTSRSRPRA